MGGASGNWERERAFLAGLCCCSFIIGLVFLLILFIGQIINFYINIFFIVFCVIWL